MSPGLDTGLGCGKASDPDTATYCSIRNKLNQFRLSRLDGIGERSLASYMRAALVLKFRFGVKKGL